MNTIDLAKWVIKDLRRNSFSFQIEEYIIEQIKVHALQPGEVLPSIRELARVNGINKNTVHLAYNKLISRGWLTYTHGSRTKVAFNYSYFDLESKPHDENIPDYLQPDIETIKKRWPAPIQNFIAVGPPTIEESWTMENLISKSTKRIRETRQGISPAQKINDEKSFQLEESIVEHLNLTRGFHTQLNNVHIVKGRSESIKDIFHLLFTSEDIVINTSPGDLLINWVLREGSIQVIKVDIDSPNFIKTIRSLASKQKIKAVYVRPNCSYPKGKVLSQESSLDLIELAKRFHFLIIEEDDDHEFWYEKQPFKPLINYPNNGHVIYTGVLSRLSSYMQTLRTIVAPNQIIKLLKELPLSIYESRDNSEELAIAHLIHNGDLALYARKARKQKQLDLKNMHKIFQTHIKDYVNYDPPITGLSIWLEFTDKINLCKILNRLTKAGVQVPYYPEKQRHLPKIYNMRLDFSCYRESECTHAAIMIQKIYHRLIRE